MTRSAERALVLAGAVLAEVPLSRPGESRSRTGPPRGRPDPGAAGQSCVEWSNNVIAASKDAAALAQHLTGFWR